MKDKKFKIRNYNNKYSKHINYYFIIYCKAFKEDIKLVSFKNIHTNIIGISVLLITQPFLFQFQYKLLIFIWQNICSHSCYCTVLKLPYYWLKKTGISLLKAPNI